MTATQTNYTANALVLAESIIDQNPTYIKLGQIIFTKTPENYNLLGIGTCLAVFLYDLKRNNFIISHCLLPSSEDYVNGTIDLPGKFVDSAIRIMIEKMVEKGSSKRDIFAKIVGGGQIFEDHMLIGQRNIETGKKVLKELDIPIIAEDVGGKEGRSIQSFASDASIQIKKKGVKYTI